MRARWEDFTGVLCDDPGELVGLEYAEPELEDLWAEMSPAERARETVRSLR